MNIATTRDDLLKPLVQVGGVVERRQTLPILANVLIQAKSDHLEITATDLEVEMRTRTPVQASEEVEFTVPARKLLDICKALPEGVEVSIDVEGDKLVLRSGRGRYTLGLLPAQDYPTIEAPAASYTFTVAEGTLKRMIDKTQFAMAHQDVRYYLNGLLLEVRPGRIRTVATDGHRLALCDEKLPGLDEMNLQVLLPRKAIQELSRLLSDGDQPARVQVSGSHVRVLLDGGTVFTSKLIDGRFPDYERVMPSGETEVLLADRQSMRQALARTAILSNEKYRGIRFRLSKGLLHLQAHNPEQDEAEEEVEIDYEGNEMTIGFNVSYLLDVLGVLDGDQIEMAVIDANSSSLITPAGQEGSCRYVVMPMRL